MKNLKKIVLFTLISLSSSAYQAGHCSVGPFGTDGDTGPYQGRCHGLSAQEICDAYLLGIEQDEILDVDPAKVQYCMNLNP